MENHYIALNENHISQKLLALKEYKEEVFEFPHMRSIKYITNLLENTGAEVSKEFAEKFYIELSISE